MKNNSKYEDLLSAYIDGELSTEESEFVEEVLLSDPYWKQQYQGMLTLRDTMKSSVRTYHGKPLWPGVLQRIRSFEKNKSVEILPTRLVPVVTFLAMIIVGISTFLLTRNWDRVVAYLDDTRAFVGDIAEQGIVQGVLQPLFDGVTNDDLIRFAFSGVLPIPETDGRALKIGSERDYQFEFELADVSEVHDIPSLSELYANLEVTGEQQHAIDSVLTRYREILRQSAFIADHAEVMISPELAGMDRFILASVAQHLKPRQRETLNIILSKHNRAIRIPGTEAFGPFPWPTLAEDGVIDIELRVGAAPRETVGVLPKSVRADETIATPRSARSFIVVRGDSIVTTELELPDFTVTAELKGQGDRIRRQVKREVEQALRDVRIEIKPKVARDQQAIELHVFGQFGYPQPPERGAYGHKVQVDSLLMGMNQKEHFLRLQELSEAMKVGSPFVSRDTTEIHERLRTLNGRLEHGLRQMEFDMERLHEEIRKMLSDPQRLMFNPDSIFFLFFPDSLRK